MNMARYLRAICDFKHPLISSRPNNAVMRYPFSARLATTLCLTAVLSASGQAQIYKWTDSAGRTHYGDKPSEEAQAKELPVSVTSFDGPPTIDDWAAIIRRPTTVESLKPKPDAPAPTMLTMYSTSWCGYCRLARSYLAEKGVAYREVNVEASQDGRKEFARYGGGGVPLFISGGKRMRGFSASSMDRFLATSVR